ncbi:MAG: SDR family NAD(P)-dependent oxidoreductase, partial [Planctomycetaceae bacterium]|nr:SDR family NAD(P)-dependent oxidoreductase [Planctomycetaceae bacterium]
MLDTTNEYLDHLFGLSGKTAVVIGGTGVLGGAFVDALIGAGAYVIVVGRNAAAGADVVARCPERTEFFAADSTSRDDLEKLVAHLRQSS